MLTPGWNVVRTLLLLGLVLLRSVSVVAEDEGAEAKMISGMSIVGNNEAPKSLFIVPWKSSEIGFETGLASGLLNDSMSPVDKDVFMREVDFYEIRSAN